MFRHVLSALGGDRSGHDASTRTVHGVAALDDTDPATATALARLRRDCVEAKEVLSFSVDTVVPVALPGITRSVRLTRGEFDDMLRPAIAETVSAMRRVLEASGVGAADVAAMVLVGGSSRIPLVSEMLSAAFGRPLALDNHPKHDVALGAAIRGTPAAQPAGVAAAGAPVTAAAARAPGAAAGPAPSGPPPAAPVAVPSAQPPPPAWAGGPASVRPASRVPPGRSVPGSSRPRRHRALLHAVRRPRPGPATAAPRLRHPARRPTGVPPRPSARTRPAPGRPSSPARRRRPAAPAAAAHWPSAAAWWSRWPSPAASC